ncbi:hypothetical protein Cni_G24323 [Canna indica]|uniref:Late embryogenesis abundant protein LEA-2 subgroup domain-containing protein n=1 Tax=Canna indica TaxID=4628 RepID=A0AAQ3L282_9LILI|nr:hypothetical protein Cni_G24323 [Canna indica]
MEFPSAISKTESLGPTAYFYSSINRLKQSIGNRSAQLHSLPFFANFPVAAMSSSASDPKPIATGYPAPAAGAAYPYHAPPPPSYYHNGAPPPPQPHYYPPAYAAAPPPPRYNTTFLRRLLLVAVSFFILLGLIVLIIWLVLRPRLPEVSVSSFSISGFNLSASQPQSPQLSGNFDLNLTVHNPNGKMGIYYDRVTAAVLYGSDTLSETFLAPFYQWKGETTALPARLVAAGEYVDSDVVKGINSERGRGDGAVSFHVRVLAWVRFRSGAWRTRWHVLRIYCDNVPIGFRNGSTAATTGSLVGSTPKKCVSDL